MTQYEKVTNELGTEIVKRIDDDGKEWFIPLDPANSDYQEYLKSLNEAATL